MFPADSLARSPRIVVSSIVRIRRAITRYQSCDITGLKHRNGARLRDSVAGTFARKSDFVSVKILTARSGIDLIFLVTGRTIEGVFFICSFIFVKRMIKRPRQISVKYTSVLSLFHEEKRKRCRFSCTRRRNDRARERETIPS